MITKIGLELGKKTRVSQDRNNSVQHISYSNEQNKFENTAGKLNINYFIPFLGLEDKNGQQVSKYSSLMFHTDTSAKKLIKQLEQDVKDTGYDKITTLHVLRRGMLDCDKYLQDLETGKKVHDIDLQPPMAEVLSDEVGNIFSTTEQRKKIKPLLKVFIKELDELLEIEKPDTVNHKSKFEFSDDLTDSIWSIRQKQNEPVNASLIMNGAFSSEDEITYNFVMSSLLSLFDTYMINHTPLNERAPFSEYENNAAKVLKNLSLGTNVFVTYDSSKEVPQNFLDTLNKVLQKSGDKKTSITELNYAAKPEFLLHLINNLSKDKSRTHIIAMDPSAMMAVATNDLPEDEKPQNGFIVPPELSKLIMSCPANIKILFFDSKNNYYAISSAINLYKDFMEASLPVLSTSQMIKAFKENPILMKDIKVPFSKKAIEKTVEASAQLDGVFPDKTQNLMKKIAGYYIDKKEINEKDIANYVKEATNLFKKDVDDSSIDVVFDTGKRLKDMVGKSSTKKEAQLLVNQIKSNKLGTKGIILFSQDGSAGSGRRYTAKVIAGEARVPYVEMNAVDFGTKDVDLFGGGAISPEKAVKKLFSLVKTQAEANPHKSAVLFIENFEYFTLGEMVSFYHQKAMAQLLREMDKANDAGLNILIAGSVSNPDLLGEATVKSFKFVDTIEVSSPAFNKDERAMIIRHVLKDSKIKLAGTKDEQDKTVDYAAEISQYFPHIMLKNLIQKSKSVAQERSHKAVTKGDITEAYLQLTTGRPAMNKIEKHGKDIVSSHECGHAVNLEVMNNVAKSLGKPWHIPDKVNFITLDPRGIFGGAVYHGSDINKEASFEYMFSNIVCSFGGNSAESLFYGMEGSFGISSDMEHVRDRAEAMVKVMGLGPKTGKMSTEKGENLSDRMKQMIEDDERVIINNAKITSDMITEVYADFNRWFTQKYSPLVGTGECLLDGDEFRNALNEWKASQSPEKQRELKLCDTTILKIMEATKKGIAVRKEK